MGDHVVLVVDRDRLIAPSPTAAAALSSLPAVLETSASSSSGAETAGPSSSSSSSKVDLPDSRFQQQQEEEEHGVSGEETPLLRMVECRICQDEDSVGNLEMPCACSGSLKVLTLNAPRPPSNFII